MDGRDKPGHDVDGEGTRRALQALQQILRAGNLRFAGRVLDVKRLHHAVVDHHGVALRARAEAAFPEVDREADRLRESRAAVGEKLDLAGRAGVLLPGVHDKHVVDAGDRDRVDALLFDLVRVGEKARQVVLVTGRRERAGHGEQYYLLALENIVGGFRLR